MRRRRTTVALALLQAVCLLGLAFAQDIDPEVVRAKIGALAERDDTIARDEQPRRWLARRRQEVAPYLIEGLDSDKARVASQCLKLLDACPKSKALAEALMRVAADKEHPIGREAALSLCRFGEYPGVPKLLEQAALDAERFPDPRDRAGFAEALGRKKEAVALLVPLLAETESGYELRRIIKRLGNIAHPSAATPLAKAAKDRRWDVAAAARLALAQVDPAGHALTKDQSEFLTRSGRRYKADWDHIAAQWRKLAELNRDEIRPLVMQMLAGDQPRAALEVLKVWKDRDALPEIRRHMQQNQGWRRGDFMVACLEIDPAPDAVTELLASAEPDEHLARAVCRSQMPDDVRLQALRAVRDGAGAGRYGLVPGALRWVKGDVAPLLRPLMREEKDLRALAAYARAAALDERKRFAAEVLDAMKALVDPEAPRGAAWYPTAAEVILDACAAYRPPGAGPLADRLLSSAHRGIRTAAAHVSATCGGDRERALAVLHEQLGAAEQYVRRQAAGRLLDVPCAGDAERRAREEVVLSHLGRPTEDYALRVLTTCGGERAIAGLLPVLDGDDAARAAHAAWVLAQLPDEKAREKALRRLAIYGLFHHQVYQQGSGIDFTIAPDLYFHQVTGRLNPGVYESRGLQLPVRLLEPFEFDKPEQAFSVRACRQMMLAGSGRHYPQFPSRWPPRFSSASHLPLLEVMASEDPGLTVLHVRGEKVAHFPVRKLAAQTMAAITGRQASYVGLGGEAIDSDGFPPGPHKGRDRLIAHFVLGRLEKALAAAAPESNAQARVREAYSSVMRDLVNRFGEGLKAGLIAEARRRKLDAQSLPAWLRKNGN